MTDVGCLVIYLSANYMINSSNSGEVQSIIFTQRLILTHEVSTTAQHQTTRVH